MTTASDVRAVLDRVRPPGDTGFNALQLPGRPSFRVGRGGDGSVVLLTPAEVDAHVGAPTRLRRLTAHARAVVRVEGPGHPPADELVGFLELRDLGEDLVPAFCGIAATVVDLVGDSPAPGAVRAALRHVVRLFEPRPGGKGSVLGIWGELLTALSSAAPARFIEAWHVDIDDRFDFAAPASRLEVKTTQSGSRAHEFDLAQLSPVEGAVVHVASIVTTATSAGTSVGELVDELQTMLADRMDLILKIYDVIAETLGEDWVTSTRGLRWDRTQAEAGLRLLRAEDVPSIRQELDPTILWVRLKVDVGDVPFQLGPVKL